MKAKKIDVELAKELFYYDESSPTFLRAKINSAKRKAGDVAGGLVKATGYYSVKIKGKPFKVHRIILALHGNELSDDDKTDHIDGNKLNNNINNLRVVTQSKNAKNQKKRSDNKTGVTGVEKRIRQSGRITWSCKWTEEKGRKKEKTFKTMQEAIDFRRNIIAELNKNGAGYTERHGK